MKTAKLINPDMFVHVETDNANDAVAGAATAAATQSSECGVPFIDPTGPTSVARPESEALAKAIIRAESLLAGPDNDDDKILAVLIERARYGQPVKALAGTIDWSAIRTDVGVVAKGKVSHRLVAAGAAMLAHLTLDHGPNYIDPNRIEGCELTGTAVPAEIMIASMEGSRVELGSEAERLTLDHLIELMNGKRTLLTFNGEVSVTVIAHCSGSGADQNNRPCSAVIHRWAPFFRLDEGQTTIRDGVVVSSEATPVSIQKYLDGKHSRREPLHESNKRRGQASLAEIQADSGICYASLRNYRHLIDAAVATEYVKLQPPKKMSPGDRVALKELRLRRLNFIDKCIAKKVMLPMRHGHRNAYDFAAIAAMSDIEGPDLADDLTYMQFVYDRAPLKELPKDVAPPGSTYGLFETELREARHLEVADKKSAKSLVAQTMGAYRTFRKFTDREMDGSVIGDELSQTNVERVLAKMKADASIRGFSDLQTNLRIVSRLHALVSADDGLGKNASDAIRIAILRSGKSLPDIAKLTGISDPVLHSLTNGGSARSTTVRLALPALERACGIDEGRLVALAKTGPKTQGLKQGKRKVPTLMTDFVAPDWATMSDDEFDDMIAWIDDNIIHQPTPFGAAMATAAKLGRAAARMRNALGVDQRLSDDLGPNETRPFRKTLDCLVAHRMDVFGSGSLARRRGVFWTDHTARMRIGMLLDLANFATDPVETGGLGIDPGKFDFAHLLNTDIPKVYVDQKADRLAAVEFEIDGETRKRGAVFTRLHADLMTLLASIFDRPYGFAYQQPEMAAALDEADERPMAPLKHLTSTDAVQRVLKNYKPVPAAPMTTVPAALVGLDADGYMEASAKGAGIYRGLGQDLYQKCRRSRDPVVTVRGITNADEPLKLVLEHLNIAAERTPNLIADPVGHHLHKRNMVTSMMALLLVLRPRNMRELTSSGDLVRISKKDSRWTIEIPHDEFKNWKSTPLFADQSPFLRTIPDMPGLRELMDYYWEFSRPYLVGDNGTPNFLVDAKGMPLNPQSYYRLTRSFTARHLAYNPYTEIGIPGVMPFNPYAWRYIRATDILLHPSPGCNPYLEAANALQTSEAMILRYYARVRPDARNSLQDARFTETLAAAWRRRA